MATTKLKGTSKKIKELKGVKPEKITDEQLQKVQNTVNDINRTQFKIGTIEIEKHDALLPTMGGQTAINIALELHNANILKKYNVEMIGAKFQSLNLAEDRELFKKSMNEIGLESPKSNIINSNKI